MPRTARILFLDDNKVNGVGKLIEEIKQLEPVESDGYAFSNKLEEINSEKELITARDNGDVDMLIIVFDREDGIKLVTKWGEIIEKQFKSPLLVVWSKENDAILSADSSDDEAANKPLTTEEALNLTSAIGGGGYYEYNLEKSNVHEHIQTIWEKTLSHLGHRWRYQNKANVDLSNRGLKLYPGYIASGHLDNLDLSHNSIIEFSCKQIITNLFANITHLNLSHNHLLRVSPLVGRLKLLTHFDVSYNYITSIPSTLAECDQLTKLNFQHNNIDSLPTSLHNLKKITYLNLKENPLGAILPEVLPKHRIFQDECQLVKLGKYLEALSSGKSSVFNRVKVMFVGDANVGKSSMLYCMVKNKPYHSNFNVATDGIDLKEVHSGDCVFDCWDFAGQELYYTTHQFFLTSKAIYLLLFNLVDPNIANLTYWLKSIRMRARYASIVMVGTHADNPKCTPAYIESTIQSLKQQFKSYNIDPKIYTVSNIQKDKNIKILKESIEEIAKKRKLIGGQIPTNYTYLINKFATLKKETPYTELSDLAPILDSFTIPKSQHISALELLHNLGYILYYGTDVQLKDLVFLDPEFLMLLMKSIVSMKNRWVKNGLISETDMNNIFKEYPPHLRDKFLRLLSLFEVIFRLPTGDWVVPAMHNATPDVEFKSFNFKGSVPHYTLASRVYKFKFMPFGFYSRLVTRVYSLSEMQPKHVWRNGMLISSSSSKSQKGAMEWNPETYTLTIGVLTKSGKRSSKTQHMLIRLLEAVDSIIAVFHTGSNDKIEIVVPWYSTNKEEDILSDVTELSFTYPQVVNAGIAGQLTLTDGGHTVPLAHLAPDIARLQSLALSNVIKENQLGEGAFGIVYKGKLNDSTPIAIKELKQKQKDDDDDQAPSSLIEGFTEFMHEVNIMTRFDSPYLIKLYGTSLNPLSMVMEFCPGKSLEKILYDPSISDEKLPMALRLKWALDIANGVKALHSHKPAVMHRDLRSPNVFITSMDIGQGSVHAKVGDFGLAQYTLPSLSEMLACWQWLGPEVFDPNSPSYDEKSDVYSFGVVLSEIVSRTLPFNEKKEFIETVTESLTDEQLSDEGLLNSLKSAGYSVVGSKAVKEQYRIQEIKQAIIEKGLRPSLPDICPQPIADLINDCWAKDPAARPSIDVVIQELTEIIHNIDQLTAPTEEERFRRSSSLSLSPGSREQVRKTFRKFKERPTTRIDVPEERGRLFIKSISIKDFRVPAGSSVSGRGFYLKTKFLNHSYKSPVKKTINNEVVWDVNWEIPCLTTTMLPIELGLVRFFGDAFVAKSIVNVFCNVYLFGEDDSYAQATFPLKKMTRKKQELEQTFGDLVVTCRFQGDPK